jgi:hypothetical protein
MHLEYQHSFQGVFKASQIGFSWLTTITVTKKNSEMVVTNVCISKEASIMTT